MKEQRRITPEEVLAAYHRHPEIKPARDCYCFDCEACAIGVLFVDGYGIPENDDTVENWAQIEFGASYESGFVSGFDDGEVMDRGDDWQQGYADGRAVAAAVFGETT